MSRPTRADVPATESIHLRVTRIERADMRSVAAELGLPLTAMIRDAVNEFVSDYRETHVFVAQKKRRM